MHLRFSSLTFKLFVICFVFVLCCTTLLTQLAYVIVKSEIGKNNAYYVEEILYKVDEYLELSHTSLQTLLLAVQSAYDSGMDTSSELQPIMQRLYELNYNYIHNLYLIYPDRSIEGTSVLSRVFNEPLPERASLLALGRQDHLSVAASPTYRSTYSDWTVTLVKALGTPDDSLVAALDMDLRRIEQRLLQINRENGLNIAIVDAAGRLVAGQAGLQGLLDEQARILRLASFTSSELVNRHESLLRTTAADGQAITIRKHASAKFGWSILAIDDERLLARSLTPIRMYYIGFLIGGAGVSLLTAYVVARYLRGPLMRIMERMNQIRLGKLDVSVAMRRNDEFGVLSTTFDQMLGRIRELMSELHAEEALKRKAELQMLQAQINPHFLYNTLGSISNAVSLGKLDKVDPIIQALIRIMEYGLSDAEHPVTLREELDNVMDYMHIQRVRYNREFPLVLDVPDTLATLPVIRMLLQPIVENCIFHGYKGGRLEGGVRIAAQAGQGTLCITVEDRGAGMDEAKRARILERPLSQGRARDRIGLVNIHQRIRLRFGPAFGLTIASAPGEGTVVRIALPWPAFEHGGESTCASTVV
ncbi:sensor histidine kinase [Paenibacillus sp. IB182496]|uniref:Sensor histidine kinase n=1 Tax=Paenibacillus sabuli TaxID=2772509 RepID=A0A927BXQ9_9BACL|nr:sensor histidine kinase [Paenibacillus sabuli]MBD2847670.1 sensor histidine kinase [Paenibacillus sabuli]